MKYFALGLLFALLLSSCRAASSTDGSTGQATTPTPVPAALATVRPLSAAGLPAATPAAVADPAIQPSPTAVITIVPTISPSAFATATPLALFRALRFSTTPDVRPQQVFPAGTTEIYAIWEYRNMQVGDRIRRIWFRDDKIWLTREEYWDWDLYQASGTVGDISIYDDEGDGLNPGNYRLQLYVNDNLQQEAAFTVLAP